MADQESKIRELQAKIEQNKQMRDKAIQIRKLSKDRNVVSQCDTQIKEAQKYIDYFAEELHKVQTRSSRSSFNRNSSDEYPASETSHLDTPAMELTASPVSANQDRPPRSSSMVSVTQQERKRYSNLDLLTSSTPYNKPKVSLKLHELEYKLDVEKKLLAGFKNMATLLDKEPSITDRRNRGEVQGQLYESIEKLSLLNRALRKYKGLYIGEGDEDDYELETPPAARMAPGSRRPITGKLVLQFIEARDLAHAPTRMIRSPDTVVIVKIDGSEVFRTKPSRNDRWLEECEIHVNKASEVEISLYDQDRAVDRSLPIGVFWLKTMDIAEGLRKRKVQQQLRGWATSPPEQADGNPAIEIAQPEGDSTQPDQAAEGGIEAWFDVEPLGELALRLHFVREAGNRRPLDKLGRAGAVRQRREEVHEMNGHQFVEKKFYNIMKCALCGEFLVSSGFQCEDCEYSCHKDCYTKVVTKCISKLQSDTDPDEERLNHRIPHRFEPITNIGANWCCHCGYMLPLGSRGAKRCSECVITCHTKCAHLVPDFCGLSMEQANQMLAEIKAAKRKTLETGPSASTSTGHHKSNHEETQAPSGGSPALPPVEVATSQMSQMTLQPSPQPTHDSGYNTSSPNVAPGPPRLNMPPPGHHPSQPPMLPPHGQPYPPHPQGMDPRYQPYPQQGVRPPPTMPQPQYVQKIPGQDAMMGRPPYNQPYPPMEKAQQPPPAPPVVSQEVRKTGLNDFNFLAVLGKGNFGKVMLAENAHDTNLYAIKVLKKRFIIDNDEIESVRSEKRVFQAANRARHPFLINLHSTFQTESRVYFVMEYVSGGDLMWHIQREPFSERRAKFYSCEVLLALEYFHSQGIVYRDLKLDNIMLGLDGHIKIADYGLCKENLWYGKTTGTFCGTPEFMAPEILLEQPYGRAVDWWAYGVLIYEMLLGQSPFRGEDEDEIFDAILEDDILYPINMSRDSVSICQRLLTREPQKRLGAGPNDAVDIKEHPFFRGVNWEDMLNKQVAPPFYPSVTGALDTSNFDEEFTRELPALTPIDSNMASTEQQEFVSFSYVAEWAGHNESR
ncbi:Serine/threonine kinase [Apophysomyces sp. BC1015]|nr:Serine/threonine kinase [Apophysomyces sp. BC1015]KAG0183059.1 Serine/threonine kinase [Apophysomyces sp. BC1021]